jgi:potassium/chloride transporter 9
MVGVFSATLSAALSCLIGASRILQAISRDNLLGDPFLVFSKEKKEPVRAVLLSWALVQLVLVIKTITTIAPIVAMLFLLSYAITNFACFFLTISGTVNFRPRFRLFSWHTALAGGLSCIIIMFVVEPSYVFPAHPYVLRICAQTVLSSLIRALPVPAKSDMRR